MLYTVQNFCDRVASDLNGFIDEVADINRNVSDEEKKAYAGSYPIVGEMLARAMARKPSIGSAHISTGQLLLEYKLPAASAWCDLVLLGDNAKGGQEVVIIELKNYQKNNDDAPGEYEGLMRHKGATIKHPADQVKGYAEYCRRFHSTVQGYGANVNGCVYFTQPIDLEPYRQAPNNHLTEEYALYNKDNSSDLAEYIIGKIEKGNETFAARFIDGYYKQDRNILRQVAQNLQAEEESAKPFVLLDEQRFGFNRVMGILQERVKDGKKEVIIVQGPPGSGKSAIAINIWIEAVMKYSAEKDCGNIVYVTTSSSQADNWNNIFNEYGKFYHAEDLALRSNAFNPGMNGGKMKDILLPRMRKIDRKYVREDNPNSLKYEYYEDYTNYMIAHNMTSNYKDNLHFMSVVDEAHALINPAKEGFRCNKTSGWCFQMGPQAYHIIRESQVSVFFTDDKQSFRDNESTSVVDIEALAAHLGARVSKVSLDGMQFRCAGSKDYVEWVERLFTPNPLSNHNAWKDNFMINIVDYPSEMEKVLRGHIEEGDKSCRILSSYSVNWNSGKDLDTKHSKEAEYDFDLEDKDGRRWQRYWNNPEGYDIFVQSRSGSKMADDPLSEVGCPYVVRGFDYDYVGMLWLDDIFVRNGKWMVSIKNVKETSISTTRGRAVEEQKSLIRNRTIRMKMGDIDVVPAHDPMCPAAMALFKSVSEAYRINMTRAMKELTIYVKDPETREYLRNILKI